MDFSLGGDNSSLAGFRRGDLLTLQVSGSLSLSFYVGALVTVLVTMLLVVFPIRCDIVPLSMP